MYHRGSEENPSYAVPPSITATVGEQPPLHGDGVGAVQRGAQHPAAVGAPAERAQRAVEPGPDLERVTAGEPARAEDEGAEQVGQHVGADRDAQHRQRRPVGRDQLQPGEGEQPQRRGPVTGGPVGERAVRVQPGQGGEAPVQPADRVQHRPHRPEDERDGRQPDPEPHVHDVRHGVVGVVAAEDQRGQGPARQGEGQHHRGAADDAGVEHRRGPTGEWDAAFAAQPRLVPQRAERDEGHDQGRGGPENDRGERQRQVLPGADAVGGQAGGWTRRWRERASARREALRPPVSARRRTAASAAGGASRPGTHRAWRP